MSEETKIPIGENSCGRITTNLWLAAASKELETPALGALCKVKLEDGSEIFGLITNIQINDDGLVKQLVSG